MKTMPHLRERLIAFSAFQILVFTGYAADAPVFIETFETPKADGLYQALLKQSHNKVVANKGVGGGWALETTFEGSDVGSERVVARHAFGERGDEYTLNYDVRFEHDFQFVRGGKLHGLGPDSPITGGKAMRPEGWSARLMFTDSDGLKTYLYCQNKDGKYGVSVPCSDFRFQKGRYYAVSLHVKLNKPAKRSNGFAHVYIDGALAARHDGIQFRGEDGDPTLISSFLFSAFHGGHEPHWAPKDADGNYVDVHACFDNIAVYRGKRVRSAPGE